jgi:hypothetical protein
MLDGQTQNLLGQCHAFIVAMLGTPVRPDYRKDLLTLSLSRGAQAITAIEGNTLSESEVDAVQAGKSLPSSKECLRDGIATLSGCPFFNGQKMPLLSVGTWKVLQIYYGQLPPWIGYFLCLEKAGAFCMIHGSG